MRSACYEAGEWDISHLAHRCLEKLHNRMVISVSSSYDMSAVGKVQNRKEHAEKRYMKGTKKIKENNHGRMLTL